MIEKIVYHEEEDITEKSYYVLNNMPIYNRETPIEINFNNNSIDYNYIVDNNGKAYYFNDLIKVQKLQNNNIITSNANDKVYRWYLNDFDYKNFTQNSIICSKNSSSTETQTSSWAENASRKMPEFNVLKSGSFDIPINKDLLEIYSENDLSLEISDKDNVKKYLLFEDNNNSIIKFNYKLDDYGKLIFKVNIDKNNSVQISFNNWL